MSSTNTPTGKLTPQRLQQLLTEIHSAGNTARTIDPAGDYSYAAMAGGLSSVLKALVRDLAGARAAQEIDAAFVAAFGESA